MNITALNELREEIDNVNKELYDSIITTLARDEPSTLGMIRGICDESSLVSMEKELSDFFNEKVLIVELDIYRKEDMKFLCDMKTNHLNAFRDYNYQFGCNKFKLAQIIELKLYLDLRLYITAQDSELRKRVRCEHDQMKQLGDSALKFRELDTDIADCWLTEWFDSELIEKLLLLNSILSFFAELNRKTETQDDKRNNLCLFVCAMMLLTKHKNKFNSNSFVVWYFIINVVTIIIINIPRVNKMLVSPSYAPMLNIHFVASIFSSTIYLLIVFYRDMKLKNISDAALMGNVVSDCINDSINKYLGPASSHNTNTTMTKEEAYKFLTDPIRNGRIISGIKFCPHSYKLFMSKVSGNKVTLGALVVPLIRVIQLEAEAVFLICIWSFLLATLMDIVYVVIFKYKQNNNTSDSKRKSEQIILLRRAPDPIISLKNFVIIELVFILMILVQYLLVICLQATGIIKFRDSMNY